MTVWTCSRKEGEDCDHQMHRVSDRGRVRQLCRDVRVHGWGRRSGADEGRNIRVRLLQWLRGSLVLSSGLAAGMGFKLRRQSY